MNKNKPGLRSYRIKNTPGMENTHGIPINQIQKSLQQGDINDLQQLRQLLNLPQEERVYKLLQNQQQSLQQPLQEVLQQLSKSLIEKRQSSQQDIPQLQKLLQQEIIEQLPQQKIEQLRQQVIEEQLRQQVIEQMGIPQQQQPLLLLLLQLLRKQVEQLRNQISQLIETNLLQKLRKEELRQLLSLRNELGRLLQLLGLLIR